MDNRTGMFVDGRRVWPAVDINGAPYDRTNYGAEFWLSPDRFVILPQGFMAWDTIATLMETAADDGSKESVRRRGNVPRPASDTE